MHSNPADLAQDQPVNSKGAGDNQSTFSVEWSQNDALNLNPNKPLKAHRGWERQPYSPVAQKKRSGKIWRRYNSRSQTNAPLSLGETSQLPEQISPRKITKKLRLAEKNETHRDAATKWEKDSMSGYREF